MTIRLLPLSSSGGLKPNPMGCNKEQARKGLFSESFYFGMRGGYCYSFNGMERDDEWNGVGNMYDYGFRIYDPMIAKFLSVEPLFQSYSWYTPYQIAGNMPVNPNPCEKR